MTDENKKSGVELTAKTIVDKLVEEDGLDVGAMMHRSIEERIIKALKEQDAKTRHACAEAVLKCNKDVSGECIWVNEAHSACMNVDAKS